MIICKVNAVVVSSLICCCSHYSKFRFFCVGILFSRIALKDIFATLKIRELGHGLPTSVNERVISAFREGLIFTKLPICEKMKLTKISEFTECVGFVFGPCFGMKFSVFF